MRGNVTMYQMATARSSPVTEHIKNPRTAHPTVAYEKLTPTNTMKMGNMPISKKTM